MHILRTRFKKDIVTEFLPPMNTSNKIIILCSGIPSYPSKKELMEFFSKKGYWVFLPRYRGSWESDGSFLKESPHQDIIDIIDDLPNGFKNMWDGKIFSIKPSSIYLFGSSFGGPAMILTSVDKRVTKVVAFSPVIDWVEQDKIESLDNLKKFIENGFGNGYRINSSDWVKLKTGTFYNPATFEGKIDGSKIFIFQNEDDQTVPYVPTVEFSKKISCRLMLMKKGGHMSIQQLLDKKFYKKVLSFIRKKS